MNYESPHDEAVLLAAITSLTRSDTAILDRVSPDDFSEGNVREIWIAAREVRDAGKLLSPRNILGVRDTLPIRSRLKAVDGHVVTDSEVAQAESAVIQLAKYRRLDQALMAARERLQASTTYSEALEYTHAEIDRLGVTETPESVVWFDGLVDRWSDWNNAPPRARRVIPTPWWSLNEKIAGGLHPGRSYVVGGRPGGGKSIAGANLALHAAENGFTSVIFSVEMGNVEVTSRLLAAGAQVRYGDITRRSVSQNDMTRIGEYVDSNNHMPLAVVDKSNVSVEYITAVCRSIKRSRGLDVVFVDYLQLLKESDSKAARERQVAKMSAALKIMSRELDCAVIIACQLNRNSANEKRPPTLADLRESGSIEQDCDVAILLHHPEDKPGDIELVVAKNRTGSIGTIAQQWAAHQSRIA